MHFLQMTLRYIMKNQFFAPSNLSFIDFMVQDHDELAARIKDVGEFLSKPSNKPAFSFFIEAQKEAFDAGNGRGSLNAVDNDKVLSDTVGALTVLRRQFWRKAIKETGVFDLLPAKRREELESQLDEKLPSGEKDDQGRPIFHVLPDFTKDSLHQVIHGLLIERGQFFAEMVEGVFTSLSGEHVTNAPQGFSKRLILADVVGYISSWSYNMREHFHDLRRCVAVLLERTVPHRNVTADMIDAMPQDGQWRWYDGYAYRMRAYKKGTVHVEMSSQIVWRLNEVLASRYPAAIPPEFRRTPKKTPKDEPTIARRNESLSDDILNCLRTMLPHDETKTIVNYRSSPISTDLKRLYLRVRDVLVSVGAAEIQHKVFQFEHPAKDVLAEIIRTGSIPDAKSFQFYPTPEEIASAAVEMADVYPGLDCLEPSAGTGNIARVLDTYIGVEGHLQCVEISPLFCKALESRDLHVQCCDFMQWTPDREYDRIVMNPPYDRGQWKAHVSRAAGFLKPGGILVAVLPLSASGVQIDGVECIEGPVFDNQFEGTGISVQLFKYTKVK